MRMRRCQSDRTESLRGATAAVQSFTRVFRLAFDAGAWPPPERLPRAQSAPPIRIFQEDRATGEMRIVDDDRSLWR